MKEVSYPIQASTEAWLNCENLLINIFQKDTSFSKRTRQVVDECAHICLGTVHALKSGWSKLNLKEIALLCVGICEECAEVCERYNDVSFKECAATCRHCSAVFTQFVTTAV